MAISLLSFGNEVDTLDYTLYNNSIPYGIDVDKVKWQIPPRIDQDKVQKSRSRFKISNYEQGKVSINIDTLTDVTRNLPYCRYFSWKIYMMDS